MEAGLLKGQAGILAKLLKLRFGPLPEEVAVRSVFPSGGNTAAQAFRKSTSLA